MIFNGYVICLRLSMARQKSNNVKGRIIMINNNGTLFEVKKMAKGKNSIDAWDEIIDSLILETEPPICYIKDAIVVTKSGISYKLSPTDFAELVAKEKLISPEQSEIHHCSLSIDFTRIKRDVNKWTKTFISEIENEISKIVTKSTVTKKSKSTKIVQKKSVVSKKSKPVRRKSN